MSDGKPVWAKVPTASTSPVFSLELPQGRRRGTSEHDVRPASHYGIDEVVEDGADNLVAQSPTKLVAGTAPTSRRASATKQAKPTLFRRFSGVPDPRAPPTVVDSGLAHDLIHVNCTPMPGVAKEGERLVATLFYKGPEGGGAGGTAGGTAGGAAGGVFPGSAPASASGLSRPSSSGGVPGGGGGGVGSGAAAIGASDAGSVSSVPSAADLASFPMEWPPAESEPSRDGLYGAYVSPICIAAFLHLMSTFPHTSVTEEEAAAAAAAEAATGEDIQGTSTYASGYGSNLQASHRYLDSNVQPRVVEVVLRPVPALALADLRRHEQLYRFEREWNVEVVLQPDSLWRRHPRLVVFDMDSTLITQEVIDMLAAAVTPEIAARVADITHRAMAGELNFEAAFRERVKLLTGLPATLFDDLRPQLDVTNGVPALLRALRRLGVRTAVLSGGFQPLTGWLAGQLGINHAHANHVVIGADGRLTGDVTGAIVGRERKNALLQEIAAQEHIDLRQVVAVGDGANDLLMLGTAGLGVAWHAKPLVQLEADARLNRPSLLDLLYLFGFTSTEIAELAEEEKTGEKAPAPVSTA